MGKLKIKHTAKFVIGCPNLHRIKAHPAPYCKGTEAKRSGREATLLPPSSAEVQIA
jgi:hypothetical protein